MKLKKKNQKKNHNQTYNKKKKNLTESNWFLAYIQVEFFQTKISFYVPLR